eukprot:TRINITY_DN1001_c1_g2_i1.p1 TRINITY_DN1001_c1_g2~~TRINITY_DN1001_c1_g2_i1.p1  ORF type:complete len:270 (+),score=38.19 TRINITY_DN1001_c1_g2_i1:122-811(+)
MTRITRIDTMIVMIVMIMMISGVVKGRPLYEMTGLTVGSTGSVVNPMNVSVGAGDDVLRIELHPCNNGQSMPQLLISTSGVPSSQANAAFSSVASPFPSVVILNPNTASTYYIAVRGTHANAATSFNLYVFTNRYDSKAPIVGGTSNQTGVTLEDVTGESIIVSVVPSTTHDKQAGPLRYRVVYAPARNNRQLSTVCGANANLYSDVVLGEYGSNMNEFSSSTKLIFEV